ncbi:hypothetical protein LTR86_006292 [Recurvomyces mirabilis]|nr:hypothetical protein LTR86_006292 [Recurvomyces mirabilis]
MRGRFQATFMPSKALSVFTSSPNIGKEVWENFMPHALRSGQVRPVLRTKIAGKGLDDIQTALDEVKKGVSGTKVVVVA